MDEWTEQQKRVAEQSVPRLLAGDNRLTRVEKDKLLADVLRDAGTGEHEGTRSWRLGLIAAFAVAALLCIVIPTALLRDRPTFESRGKAPAVASFELFCTVAAKRAPCEKDSNLLFELSGTAGAHFFAAFARRQDGTVIWYFPSVPGEQALEISSGVESGVATTAVLLGDEHPPGEYRVFGLFSDTPVQQRHVREIFETDPARFVERRFHVAEEP